MKPFLAHKEWANVLRSRWDGEVAVTEFLDEPGTCRIPIFTSTNSTGIVAATIGLMEVNQGTPGGHEIRSEILMDQRGHDQTICNVLSTIAFCVLKDGRKATPGVVWRDVYAMYDPLARLPHVYFTALFQRDDMSKVALTGATVYPLLAIPISESESLLAGRNAGRDLESLWTERSVDVLNWKRDSDA